MGMPALIVQIVKRLRMAAAHSVARSGKDCVAMIKARKQPT